MIEHIQRRKNTIKENSSEKIKKRGGKRNKKEKERKYQKYSKIAE